MFIAMNRFSVLPGQEKAFEAVWLGRDTHLGGVPGFVAFHLLRGPTSEENTLYSSHTLWRSREDFRRLDPVRGVSRRARRRRRQHAALCRPPEIRRFRGHPGGAAGMSLRTKEPGRDGRSG